MADDFQKKIAFAEIDTASDFVPALEANSCAERVIFMLKRNLLRMPTFNTVEHLRAPLLEFCKTATLG